MLKKLLVGACALLMSSAYPLFAEYDDLQTAATAIQGDRVTVQVDNPNTSDESARIQLTVQVEGGAIEVLTVPADTYEASSTAIVSTTASAPIVRIIDAPDPIVP